MARPIPEALDNYLVHKKLTVSDIPAGCRAIRIEVEQNGGEYVGFTLVITDENIVGLEFLGGSPCE